MAQEIMTAEEISEQAGIDLQFMTRYLQVLTPTDLLKEYYDLKGEMAIESVGKGESLGFSSQEYGDTLLRASLINGELVRRGLIIPSDGRF